MKELTKDEVQSICLDMLRFFDSFCREHQLTYYMSGGTLLGAVRHQGFIPWDDDVDLMMPRPFYDKMIRAFRHEYYHLSCCETESDYCSAHARIWDTRTVLQWGNSKAHEKPIGVFIDIFPIDGYPESELATKLHLMRVKMASAKVSMAVKEGYLPDEKMIPVKKLLAHIYRKDGNFYARALARLARKYPFEDCAYAGVYAATVMHLYKEKNPKSIYEKTILLDFEDLKLPAPVGYKQYLQQLYGDYMQLPPVEKRTTDHMFKVYQK